MLTFISLTRTPRGPGLLFVPGAARLAARVAVPCDATRASWQEAGRAASPPTVTVALILCPWLRCAWPVGSLLPGLSLLRPLRRHGGGRCPVSVRSLAYLYLLAAAPSTVPFRVGPAPQVPAANSTLRFRSIEAEPRAQNPPQPPTVATRANEVHLSLVAVYLPWGAVAGETREFPARGQCSCHENRDELRSGSR